jgi:hypothetical protein
MRGVSLMKCSRAAPTSEAQQREAKRHAHAVRCTYSACTSHFAQRAWISTTTHAGDPPATDRDRPRQTTADRNRPETRPMASCNVCQCLQPALLYLYRATNQRVSVARKSLAVPCAAHGTTHVERAKPGSATVLPKRHARGDSLARPARLLRRSSDNATGRSLMSGPRTPL